MALLEKLRVERSAGPTVLSRRPVVRLSGTLGDAARLAETWPELIQGLETALAAVGVQDLPGGLSGEVDRTAFEALPRQVAAAEAAEEAGRLLAAVAVTLLAASRAPRGAWGVVQAAPPDFLAYWDDWMDGVGLAAAEGAAELLAAATESPGAPPEKAAKAALAKVRGKRVDGFILPVVRAAEARGIPWRLLASNDLVTVFGQGRRQRWTRSTLTDGQSYASVFITLRKDLTSTLLARAGFPVPEHRLVASRAEAAAAAEALGYPLVVKPLGGSRAQNVTLWLDSAESVAAAYAACGPDGTQALVERQAMGEPYRITVLGGRAVAAGRHSIPYVVGDGISTVDALIAAWDARARLPVADGYARFYPIDRAHYAEQMAHRLEAQGLTLESVPESGREVLLGYVPHRDRGGLYVEVTERMHPGLMRMAEEVARVVGTPNLGVDIITTDITKTPGAAPLAINEVNSSPSPRAHEQTERPRLVAPVALAEIFPEGDEGRIPVAAFLGSGEGTILGVLEALLRAAGWTPGVADPETARVAGYTLRPFTGRSAHPGVAVLRDRRVDAALFALRLNDLTRRGVPNDHAEVVAFPPGALAGGEPLLRQAARCLAGLPGKLLLTALGEETAWLREACPHRRWVAVAGPEASGKSLETDLAAGAEVVFSEEGVEGSMRAVLRGPALRDLLADRLSPGQIEAELWALAALLGLGFPPAEVRRLALRREAGDALSA